MKLLRSKRAKRIISILIPLLIVLQTGVYLAMQIRAPRFTGDSIILDGEGNPIVITDTDRKQNFFTILLVGIDQGVLTDVISIFSFDMENNQIHMLSIPRDTMVARGVSKINASHALGGMPNLQRDLSDMIGFTPDRYVYVELDSFEEIIDIIGGVEVDVPQRMYYYDPTQNLTIDLQPGRQRLNGEQAAHFVRFRSGYADADIGRIRTQQMFLQELFQQVLSPTNIFRIRPLATAISNNVETDMTIGEMVWLATQVRKFSSDSFTAQTLPGTPHMYADISFYFVNRNETLALINEKFNPYTRPITNLTLNSIRPGSQAPNTTTPQQSSTGGTSTPTPIPTDDTTTITPTPARTPTPIPTPIPTPHSEQSTQATTQATPTPIVIEL